MKENENKVGRCPFCSAETFVIFGRTQTYKCFACGKSGDRTAYEMDKKGLSFCEAKKIAAPEDPPEPSEIYRANKAATLWMMNALYGPGGKDALEYMKGRGMTEKDMKSFAIGYDDGTVVQRLLKDNFSGDVLVKAGLAREYEGRLRDRFYDRIIFPIIDRNKQVVGFGGRVFPGHDTSKKGERPKYLNSPDGPAFDKSLNLYGLNIAAPAIEKMANPYFVLCEGYMDVIAMHRAGFKTAIASLGTAFTVQQATIISGYTKNVFVAYDMDGPGRAAAVKNIKTLRAQGVRGWVIDMSPHKDPDEFINALGADEFRKRLGTAVNAASFELRQMMAASSGKTCFLHDAVKYTASLGEDEQENAIAEINRIAEQ
jgi:DNA primase